MKSIISGTGSLLPNGDLLLQLPAVLLGSDDHALRQMQDTLIAAVNTEFAAAAMGVVANFQMMNRLLDATGVPVQRRYMAVEDELGLPSAY